MFLGAGRVRAVQSATRTSRQIMARSVAASPACTRVPAAPSADAPGCACFHMIDCESALVSGRWPCACSADRDHLREVACVRRCRREGGRCEKTEAAIEAPIAAPAWPRYGTRLPLRHLCAFCSLCAPLGSDFAAGVGHSADRCTLGRVFSLTDAARPRTWRYTIAHRMRDKVHHQFLAIQPHMSHVQHFGPVHVVEL